MSSCEHLQALARFILPEEITDNLDIAGIEEKSGVLHIRLDEQAILPAGYTLDKMSPNGFFPSSSVCDFPIRERMAVLHIRRRRRVERETGKSLSRSWEITAQGTRYTVGFAAFFKEASGYAPDSGQHS
jgi:hypothetical protein